MVHSSYSDCSATGCLLRIAELQLWRTAPDLDTLFTLNKSYIERELVVHPAHDHPLCNELRGVMPFLLVMNDYGMLKFQGQPRTVAEIIHPHVHGIDDFAYPEPEKIEFEAWCRCCAIQCPAYCQGWTELRMLPFVQFCLPIDQPNTATRAQAMRFARTLLANTRLHTQISWPQGLEMPDHEDTPWTGANPTKALKYIPQADLDMYSHCKSQHGSSCAHEIRTAASEDELTKARWRPSTKYSEVNDYHLLGQCVPEFFIGPDTKIIVFGVNATMFGGLKDVEGFLIETASRCGIPRCLIDVPLADSMEPDDY